MSKQSTSYAIKILSLTNSCTQRVSKYKRKAIIVLIKWYPYGSIKTILSHYSLSFHSHVVDSRSFSMSFSKCEDFSDNSLLNFILSHSPIQQHTIRYVWEWSRAVDSSGMMLCAMCIFVYLYGDQLQFMMMLTQHNRCN